MTKAMESVAAPAARTLGRQLAREISVDEMSNVSGGGPFVGNSPESHGTDDHSPTGNPCSDCD